MKRSLLAFAVAAVAAAAFAFPAQAYCRGCAMHPPRAPAAGNNGGSVSGNNLAAPNDGSSIAAQAAGAYANALAEEEMRPRNTDHVSPARESRSGACHGTASRVVDNDGNRRWDNGDGCD